MITHSESLISLEFLDKANLLDQRGCTLKEFKRTLRPRWWALWLELLAGHLVLIMTMFSMSKLQALTSLLPLTITISALIFGYTLAYILLFFHEAAHGNIAKNRKLNDFLANILIGIFVGQDIKAYRPIHFTHHQKLGTTEDTEHTYFDPLNMRFIIESLTGIKVLKVLLNRKKSIQASSTTTQKKNFLNKQLFLGILLHLTIIYITLRLGDWALALAWCLSVGIVLPFFAAIRQVLEHRDINAKNHLDYSKVPHSPIHRLFGDSLLARTLGGAGFNRHLLHHWEPQISCTQLRELEKFLLQTAAADIIRSHQTTYTATFLRLMRTS